MKEVVIMSMPPINDEALAKNFLSDKEIPAKSAGLWYVPSIKACVPVYAVSAYSSQGVIDAENSAAYCKYGACMDIGDHYNSKTNDGKGLWCMDKITPLDTAYFKRPDGITKYECYECAVADVKYGWYMVGNKVISANSSKDIINSCCVGKDSKRNFISLFRVVGKVK